jgi:hypothetical protein
MMKALGRKVPLLQQESQPCQFLADKAAQRVRNATRLCRSQQSSEQQYKQGCPAAKH